MTGKKWSKRAKRIRRDIDDAFFKEGNMLALQYYHYLYNDDDDDEDDEVDQELEQRSIISWDKGQMQQEERKATTANDDFTCPVPFCNQYINGAYAYEEHFAQAHATKQCCECRMVLPSLFLLELVGRQMQPT